MPGDNAGRVLLPQHVVPEVYHLRLEPNVDDFTFEGTVRVEVAVRTATKEVVLHAKQLRIRSASAVLADGREVVAEKMALHAEDMTLTLAFPETLPVGTVQVHIAFSGVLNDELSGFYRSKYTVNGEARYMAVTMFAPIDARKCFPCWDEPAARLSST